MTRQRMERIREICMNHRATTKDVWELVECYKECISNREHEKARDICYGLSIVYDCTNKRRVKNKIRLGLAEMERAKNEGPKERVKALKCFK